MTRTFACFTPPLLNRTSALPDRSKRDLSAPLITRPANGYLRAVLPHKSRLRQPRVATRYTSHESAAARETATREICLLRVARATRTHTHTHMTQRTHTHSVPRASPKSLPTMVRHRRPSSSDNEQCWQRRCQPTPKHTERLPASPPHPCDSRHSVLLSPFLSLSLSSPPFLPLAVRPRKRRGTRADCTTVRRQLANPLTPTGWTLDSLVKIPRT